MLILASRRRLSAKSNLTKALNYIVNHWEGLTRFLDDGRIELDSNVVERAIKPRVLTRKNALFSGSAEGARTWAILGSFMQTCRMNEVDPNAWLTCVLERLAAGHSNKDLETLMPWNFSKITG
ncbi:IS66 family transposase [Sphingosinicella soli]|jgi:transposase|uniref:Transposase n=1 Tax=Sphingosinicella soli TaxID=333708 RepID=A0A7W7F7Y7_9SPHN|nr:transposase [Sphingosinicella soli]MBB4631088.1 hypothetical protein [Sphingosinicella soli]